MNDLTLIRLLVESPTLTEDEARKTLPRPQPPPVLFDPVSAVSRQVLLRRLSRNDDRETFA